MFIYKECSYNDFKEEFKRYSREENFPKGLRDLYNYLLEYCNDQGQPLELDVIALCWDFREMGIKEALEYYEVEALEELHMDFTIILVDSETIIIGVT
jgi:hypothetical protein